MFLYFLFDKSFQSELLRKSPGNLLRNFLRHVLEMKSVKEELQQKVYKEVMRRQDNAEYYLILTLLDNTEIKISPRPLLACIAASGVPVNNIKKIQVRLEKISEKDWDALYLQSGASVLDIVQTGRYYGNGADYSPRISEMLGSGRLTKFR